jgi:hypothetical protein
MTGAANLFDALIRANMDAVRVMREQGVM